MTAEKERRAGTCDAPPEVGCGFANSAAERAVEKTFAILGVDIHSPKEVSNFQDSLRFSDRLKKYADRGFLVLAGALALAIGGAIFVGIKTKFIGGP